MARKVARRAHRLPSVRHRAVTRRTQREVKRFSRRASLLRPEYTLLSSTYERYKRRKALMLRDRQVEDRRLFHPDRAVLLTSGGKVATHQVHRPRVNVRFRKNVIPHRLQFVDPRRTIVCRRRKRRKEVLFALRLTGKGSGRRERRYTEESEIVCR